MKGINSYIHVPHRGHWHVVIDLGGYAVSFTFSSTEFTGRFIRRQ
ncbi:MAG: DUF1883 domain-containing protein [Theionarchaea archaeon]|nr:DUF1883 domain-containing protein [Theionarchaea archaeon]